MTIHMVGLGVTKELIVIFSNVKPFKTEVNLIYRCPECGNEFEQTVEEAKFVGKTVCYCDAKIKLEPVDEVQVNIKYKNNVGTKSKDVSKEKDFGDVIVSLHSMGYRKSDAKKLGKDATSYKDYETPEKLIEDILKMNFSV